MVNLEHYVLGFVIFSLFIVGGTFIVADINANYDTDMNTDQFNNTFNTVEEMYDLGQDMKSATIDAEIESGDESWNSMTKGSYSAVRFVKDTFKLLGDIINDTSNALHIPPYFFTFTIAIITISIIFGVVFLFMRFTPR